MAVKEVATLLFQPAFACSAIFGELASIDRILHSFDTEARFLSVLEFPVIADSPLSLGPIVVLDAALTMKDSVGPLSLHDPVDLLLRLRVGNGVENSLSMVGIGPP